MILAQAFLALRTMEKDYSLSENDRKAISMILALSKDNHEKIKKLSGENDSLRAQLQITKEKLEAAEVELDVVTNKGGSSETSGV
ncbi:MAG: hypothetical protein WC551_10395 [Patescibacteria group bacterium]